jgi:hypothetical protein
MLENVSVDVVDGARVKGVLGVSVRPREARKGLNVSSQHVSQVLEKSKILKISAYKFKTINNKRKKVI